MRLAHRLLTLMIPVAAALPGFTSVDHYVDTTYGNDNTAISSTVYRAVTASDAPAWADVVVAVLVALLVLAVAAPAATLAKGRAPRVLRWCGYAAIPVAAAVLVLGLQNSPWRVALLPIRRSDTWDGGSDVTIRSLDVGMWLMYAVLIGLYALFVWRDRNNRDRVRRAPTAAQRYAPPA